MRSPKTFVHRVAEALEVHVEQRGEPSLAVPVEALAKAMGRHFHYDQELIPAIKDQVKKRMSAIRLELERRGWVVVPLAERFFLKPDHKLFAPADAEGRSFGELASAGELNPAQAGRVVAGGKAGRAAGFLLTKDGNHPIYLAYLKATGRIVGGGAQSFGRRTNNGRKVGLTSGREQGVMAEVAAGGDPCVYRELEQAATKLLPETS